MTKKNWRNLGAACILGVLTFCAVCFQWFSSLNLLLQDIVYQRSEQVNPNIKVIAIDEKTLQALGPFETWTREPYAQLIETLNQGEDAPKVIALDVLLTGEKGEEDQLLLNVCRESSNVVMASNLVFSTQLERDNGTAWANAMHIDMVEEPFGELGVVKTGFANTVQDRRDNTVRYTLLEREGYLSFAAAMLLTDWVPTPGPGCLVEKKTPSCCWGAVGAVLSITREILLPSGEREEAAWIRPDPCFSQDSKAFSKRLPKRTQRSGSGMGRVSGRSRWVSKTMPDFWHFSP